MTNNSEWWQMMFRRHAELMENYNGYTLREFKKQLDTIPYKYAHAGEVLGFGATFVYEVAGWFWDVAHWSYERKKYKEAEEYLERALDYFSDPMLDYSDNTIANGRAFMRDIVSHRRNYTYQGGHNIDADDDFEEDDDDRD